jgi:hypothetical protein
MQRGPVRLAWQRCKLAHHHFSCRARARPGMPRSIAPRFGLLASRDPLYSREKKKSHGGPYLCFWQSREATARDPAEDADWAGGATNGWATEHG